MSHEGRKFDASWFSRGRNRQEGSVWAPAKRWLASFWASASGTHLNDLALERTEKPRRGAGYAAIRCGLNSRPFSTTSTTASAASVQRKKPVANGNNVPS